jgi:hypothetical protein
VPLFIIEVRVLHTVKAYVWEKEVDVLNMKVYLHLPAAFAPFQIFTVFQWVRCQAGCRTSLNIVEKETQYLYHQLARATMPHSVHTNRISEN